MLRYLSLPRHYGRLMAYTLSKTKHNDRPNGKWSLAKGCVFICCDSVCHMLMTHRFLLSFQLYLAIVPVQSLVNCAWVPLVIYFLLGFQNSATYPDDSLDWKLLISLRCWCCTRQQIIDNIWLKKNAYF